MPPWFALIVKPQHEFKVSKYLNEKGFERFLPTYQDRRSWSDRAKILELPLFPRYVFARFEYPACRVPVLRTPGVCSIVSFGEDAATLAESEIENLRALVASGLPLRPWPLLSVGQRVRIERGPLRGTEGIVLAEKDACRMIVNIEILQRAVAVVLDRESLAGISSFSCAAAAGAA